MILARSTPRGLRKGHCRIDKQKGPCARRSGRKPTIVMIVTLEGKRCAYFVLLIKCLIVCIFIVSLTLAIGGSIPWSAVAVIGQARARFNLESRLGRLGPLLATLFLFRSTDSVRLATIPYLGSALASFVWSSTFLYHRLHWTTTLG